MILPDKYRHLVVHLKRSKYDVRIDRTTKWGNPFIVGTHGTRDEVIDKYIWWILEQPYLIQAIKDGELHNKILGCWCAPKSCHGWTLVYLDMVLYDPERVRLS